MAKHALRYLFLGLLLSISLPVMGQGFAFSDKQESSPKIHFELVNNLIIIPLEVNGTTLRFILDSGVKKPILFNLTDRDSVALNNVSKITLQGLGEGEPIEALRSRGNVFDVSGLRNPNQEVYVVLDRSMNFSPALGMNVHGIIGYDLFRDHMVELNYGRKFLRFHNPEDYNRRLPRTAVTLPLKLNGSKAFVEAGVIVEGGEEIPVNLLIDTGSGDAVWLFPDSEDGLKVPEVHYEEFLGRGLSGIIYGKRTKIDQLRLGPHVLSDAKAAFPDMASFNVLQDLKDRNGSLGGAVLKRFNMLINFPAGEITLTKNSRFSDPFHFNLAGLELEHAGMRYIAEQITDSRGVVREDKGNFGNVQILLQNRTRVSLVPEIVVSAIRAGSPADEVGLREGDVILAVNGKPVHRYKLQEVIQMINEKEGKRVKLHIERYDSDLVFSFVLKTLFK